MICGSNEINMHASFGISITASLMNSMHEVKVNCRLINIETVTKLKQKELNTIS